MPGLTPFGAAVELAATIEDRNRTELGIRARKGVRPQHRKRYSHPLSRISSTMSLEIRWHRGVRRQRSIRLPRSLVAGRGLWHARSLPGH